MTNNPSTCDPQRIERFFQQKLSNDEQAAFELHLDDCDACRRQLETSAAGEDAWSAVRESLRDQQPSRDDPNADDFALDSAVSEETSSSQATVRKLLAPTDDDRMLGRWGTYEVVGLVGAGGMGVVLKALDAALNRYVAIKILAPHLGSSGAARKRFSREAQASAAVVHDNVIEIYGVAEAAGLPYLVMPYVRGPSLQRRLDDEGPLALVEILRVGMQAAAGLAAAHAQGLVHRDVKPANILLADGIERVKLTDFGLARAADDASLTKTGILAGTPQYMSPEQARGEPVDQRSDLFSLGSVLYAMCTGRPPFRAETSYGVLRRITDEEPRPIREINPEIPDWLCGIVAKLMAKRPEDRFQSAREVSALFQQCLAHVQQPTAVPLPAELEGHTNPKLEQGPDTNPKRQRGPDTNPKRKRGLVRALLACASGWYRRHRFITGTLAMLALIGISLFAISVASPPPDISGTWQGEDWGQVTLTQTAPGQYTGTYTDTVVKDKRPGKVDLAWSRIERRFNGAWREGDDDRFGDISVRLVDKEIRGALSTDAKSKINPATPRLADFAWTRADESGAKEAPLAPANAYYYVITRFAGRETVHKLAITGAVSVMDAIDHIGNGNYLIGKKLWIARPNADRPGGQEILWDRFLNDGTVDTDYRLLPGDKLYITDNERNGATLDPAETASAIARGEGRSEDGNGLAGAEKPPRRYSELDSGPHPADSRDPPALREDLRALDAMRRGLSTSIDEVEARGEAILKKYGNAEDVRPLVHFHLAHILAQSGITRRPGLVIKHSELALERPGLCPADRLLLYIYLGDALQVSKTPKYAMDAYLRGLEEALRYGLPVQRPERPRREMTDRPKGDPNDPRFQRRVLQAQKENEEYERQRAQARHDQEAWDNRQVLYSQFMSVCLRERGNDSVTDRLSTLPASNAAIRALLERINEIESGSVPRRAGSINKDRDAAERAMLARQIYIEYRRELERMLEQASAVQKKLDEAEKGLRRATEEGVLWFNRIELEEEIRRLKLQQETAENQIRTFEKPVAAREREAAAAESELNDRHVRGLSSYDFGTLLRGVKTEHRFSVENPSTTDVLHIKSATASWSGATVEVPAQPIKPGEKAEVVVKVDTSRFVGQRDATITVLFDEPFSSEAVLWIHCFIRADVLMTPDVVSIHTRQGHAAQQTAHLRCVRPDWEILRVESTNPCLSGTVKEISRKGGEVAYDLAVDLAADAKPGSFSDRLTLVTNDTDPRAQRIMVPVEVTVEVAETSASEKSENTPRVVSKIDNEGYARDRAVAFLVKQIKDDKLGEYAGQEGGIPALVCLALLKSGVPPDDPRLGKLLADVRAMKPRTTYVVSLQTQVLCAAEPKKDIELIRRGAKFLEETQLHEKQRPGAWSYGSNGHDLSGDKLGDNSNTQFAVLALHEADLAGAKVNQDTWRLALNYWLDNQNGDGSWGYYRPLDGTGSMTCAGLACISVASQHVKDDRKLRAAQEALKRGQQWLTESFSIATNPPFSAFRHRLWNLYYLRELQLAAQWTGQARFGDHDWRAEGVGYLLGKQEESGAWRGSGYAEGNPVIATSLALLFLSRAPAGSVQNLTTGRVSEAGARETARVLSIGFQGNSQVSDSWLRAQMQLRSGDKVPMRNGRIDREFQAKINADIDRLMIYYNLLGFPGIMIVDQLDIPDRTDNLDLTLLIYEDLEVEPASVKLPPPPGTRGATTRLPPAKDATAPPPVIVVQPPGVTVRVMGIGGEDGWWLVDGSPMPNPPPPVRDTWPFLNGPMLRAFNVEVNNQTTEDYGLICSITQPAEFVAPLPLGLVVGRWHTAPLAFSAYLPLNSRTATIRVGVASGPWEDIAWRRYDDDGRESGASQGKQQASLGPAKATAGSVRITSHDQLPADEVMVIGVAKDGNPIETHYQITGDNGRRQVTATFRDITLKQLKEIKLRHRPYKFVEFRNVALQPSGKAPSPAEAEEAKLPATTRIILAALQTPVRAEFVETPLKEVVDYFKDACRIEIHLDAKALADAKVDTEAPVTFNSRMTLQSNLECILGQIGLADVVADEVLLITTAEEAKRLVKQGAIDPAARRAPRGAVAVKRIAEALHSPAARFDFAETPLEDVVKYLKDAHNIEIVIGLSAEKTKTIPPVTMSLKDVSLASALHLLLRNLGLTYVVKDEYILITTQEKESGSPRGAVSTPGDNASEQNTADSRVQLAMNIYTEYRRDLERMHQESAALQGKLEDAEKRLKNAAENGTRGAERIELEREIRGLREQLVVVAERTQKFEEEVAEKKREYEALSKARSKNAAAQK